MHLTTITTPTGGYMARNKRGRPRNAPRPAVDLGTPELIARRLSIAPNDMTLATCPLDAMKARKLIGADAYAAGEHFRACHRVKFGSPHPKAVDILKASGSEYLGNTEDAERGYRKACEMLRALSSQHLSAVENIVIHERFPDWMFKPDVRLAAHKRALEAFATLVMWDRRTVRRSAAE